MQVIDKKGKLTFCDEFRSEFTEISVVYKKPDKFVEVSITCSNDACIAFRKLWSDQIDHVEEFIVLYLNRTNTVLGWTFISRGGLSACVVDPRVIFQNALMANASGIIVCHNHPSGNITPSESDKKLTAKIKNAGEFLDINVLDHIILTSVNYYSFADDGIL